MCTCCFDQIVSSIRHHVLPSPNCSVAFSFSVDTPDPYVKLCIETAPNRHRKTEVRNNTANPVWEEVFRFYLDPDVKNNLGEGVP